MNICISYLVDGITVEHLDGGLAPIHCAVPASPEVHLQTQVFIKKQNTWKITELI